MKVKIIIFGIKKLGEYTAEKLISEGENVIGFYDNACKENGVFSTNIPILTQSELSDMVKNKNVVVLITAKNADSIFQIMDFLDSMGTLNIGIVKPRIEKFDLGINYATDNEEITWYIRNGIREKVIPRLEINLIDGCNLNCVSCTHFSSIFSKDSIYDLVQFEKDMAQISNIGKMHRLRLLGGEPLLIDNLSEYVQVCRNFFPKADIEVVTNGILIPKLSKQIWACIRRNEVGIAISPYEPTLKIRDQIESTLRDNNILWAYEGNKTDKFLRYRMLDSCSDGKISSKNCRASGCMILRRSRVYKCPIEATIMDFNIYYQIETKQKKDGIDIFAEAEIYKKIKDMVMNPVKTCESCAEHPEEIAWTCCNNPQLEDWLFKKGKRRDC